MKPIIISAIAFLAFSIACYSQEKYDSLLEYRTYQVPDRYELRYTAARKYNSNGKLIEEKRWEFYSGSHIQTLLKYTYGPNDSIKTISVSKMQTQGDWKQTELWENIYDGNLLTQIKVVNGTGTRLYEIVNLDYDAQRRLIKKSRFLDSNYVEPFYIWLYYYDQKDIPDIFTKVEGRGLLRDMYYHLYKDGKLVKYRHDNYGYDGRIITSRTEEYSYNKH